MFFQLLDRPQNGQAAAVVGRADDEFRTPGQLFRENDDGAGDMF